jgi:hypothetical protein
MHALAHPSTSTGTASWFRPARAACGDFVKGPLELSGTAQVRARVFTQVLRLAENP